MNGGELLDDSENTTRDVFLLTKPPKSDRARICLRLAALSKNAILYLAGDGVYNLLGDAIEALPSARIFACKEDLEARGVQPGRIAETPCDFYDILVEEMMLDGNRIYTF